MEEAMDGPRRRAVVIGAGPAGLTAALELLERTDVVPLVFEASDGVGGISRTFRHNGNRIDLGGHRFFSKSDRVMDWWQRILPVAADDQASVRVSYHRQERAVASTATAADGDNVMLVRRRVSRILFRRRFFDYPLSLSLRTILNLGLVNTGIAGFSYLWARAFPRRPEATLEDFIINRFGGYLYRAFFRDYTKKVWGVACTDIPADWGAQRIKGLSITKALLHAARKLVRGVDTSQRQKGTETSLIERFLYPKYGPGHMWERVTELVKEKGGTVELGTRVVGIESKGDRIAAVQVEDHMTGVRRRIEAEWFFSTMPIRDLVTALDPPVPPEVKAVADGLPYRDFMTVGLLVRRLTVHGGVAPAELSAKLPDNWIYVQEPDVMVGRIQVFNNWSPYLVADPANTVWIGLEYFLDETDEMWKAQDGRIVDFALSEMEKIGFLARADVLDSVVIRQKKAYPAYFGTYKQIDLVRDHLSRYHNLFLLGRNGQHRYNNQDHSMLTAMIAVDLIAAGSPERAAVWQVNVEEEYHEEK
jgi:protoporphyrinogen oxidase